MHFVSVTDDKLRPRWVELLGFSATVAGLGISLILGAAELSTLLHLPGFLVTLVGLLLTLVALFFPGWPVRRCICNLREHLSERERTVAALNAELSASEASRAALRREIAVTQASLGELGAKAAMLERQAKWMDPDLTRRALARAAALWSAGVAHEPSQGAYEDDPVYFQMALGRDLCSILSQPIVQRLNHVRQLSFGYLKFRSATHSRLSHSLGAAKNAELVMTKVFARGVVYSKNGAVQIAPRGGEPRSQGGSDQVTLTEQEREYLVKLAKVTALLHDLGHGPMSHALDIHIGVLSHIPSTTAPDQYYSRIYVSKFLISALAGAGLDPNDVISLMAPRGRGLRPWLHFIGDLVDSSLDVDRMDYLARDAHMTGLSVGALNMHALIERIVPFMEQEKDGSVRIELAFDRSAVPYIEQFVYARDMMYINCYEHPRKIAAEKMLGKAFQEFMRRADGESGPKIADVALLTDHELEEMVLSGCGPQTVAYQMVELLMRGLTFELVAEIPIPLDPRASEKKDMFANLPDKIQPWAWAASGSENESAYIQTPDNWAKELAEKADIANADAILVAVPSWNIVDKWRREARIRVLVEQTQSADRPDGAFDVEVLQNPNISPVVADFVYALMRVRLKVRVFAHPYMSEAERTRLRDAAIKYFGGGSDSSMVTPEVNTNNTT